MIDKDSTFYDILCIKSVLLFDSFLMTVLGKLPVPGRPTYLDKSRTRAYCACDRSGWDCLDIFLSTIIMSPTKGEGDILVSVRIPLELASVSASARQNLVPTISLEPVDRIRPNLPIYIIRTILRADKVLVTFTLFSRSQEDLDT